MAPHSQCSCLENPRDGGAWWAAVYGVAQSQTRLKRLSSSSSSLLNVLPRLTEKLHPSENLLLMALAQDLLWLSVSFSRYT